MKARSGTPLSATSTETAQSNGTAASSAGTAVKSTGTPPDLSQLRMPIGTAVSSFAQVLHAFQRGTAEIQQALGHECDLIYECRVCRNMFRSLANFLSHKRIYCTERFAQPRKHCHYAQLPTTPDCGGGGGEDDGDAVAQTVAARLDADCTQIVQLEQEFAEARPTTVVGAKGVCRDLSSVIERLRRRESAQRPAPTQAALPLAAVKVEPMAANKNEVANQNAAEDTPKSAIVLQLDRIPSSSAAVFQTLRTAEVASTNEVAPPAPQADSIRADVLELHYLQQNSAVIMLDGEGKAQPLAPAAVQQMELGVETEQVDGGAEEEKTGVADKSPLAGAELLVCEVCKMNFGTEKTLQLHVQKYHLNSTYVYPCPSCTRTFLRPAAVMQHLNVDHKKSIRRLRQMRETILRRRTRISQIHVKGPSRELVRLQQSERAAAAADASAQRRGGAGVAWPDNYTGIMSETLVGSASADALLAASVAVSGAGKSRASLCGFCCKAFERRAALSTHLKTCAVKLAAAAATAAANAGTNGGASNGGGGQHNDDESNSNSTDGFMAMLARERLMQARADAEELHEQREREQQMQQPPMQQQQQQQQHPSATDTQASAAAADPAQPNRRKRAHARKTTPTTTALNSDVAFQWDDSNGVKNTSTTTTVGDSTSTTITTTHTIGADQLSFDLSDIASELLPLATDATSKTTTHSVAGRPSKRSKTRPSSPTEQPPSTSSVCAASEHVDIEQRPTDCTICGKKFANLSNLRRHVAMFHYREKKFACRLCEFKAYRKVDVLNHIMSTHPAVRAAVASGGASDDSTLGSADDASEFVELIEVDKNKYSEERRDAVAAAVERMNERSVIDGETSRSPPCGLANESAASNGGERSSSSSSSTPIIIPVLDQQQLEEIDFDLIPMEEFTVVRTANNNHASKASGATASAAARRAAKSDASAATSSSGSGATAAPAIRRRGRPKGTTKSALMMHTLLKTSTPLAAAKRSKATATGAVESSPLTAPTPAVQNPDVLPTGDTTTPATLLNSQETAAAEQRSIQLPTIEPPAPESVYKLPTLIRHTSSTSNSSSDDHAMHSVITTNAGGTSATATASAAGGQRRPIRNRVKIANKDYVYDMSYLTADERHYAPILGRSQQRRKQQALAAEAAAAKAAAVVAAAAIASEEAAAAAAAKQQQQLDAKSAAATADQTIAASADAAALPAQQSPSIAAATGGHQSTDAVAVAVAVGIDNIPGAALHMALQAVGEQRACFNRAPEMPATHSIVPAKIIALRRSEGGTAVAGEWRVIDGGSTSSGGGTANSPVDVTALAAAAHSEQQRRQQHQQQQQQQQQQRRASNEQLLDLLTVKRRDTLMDTYHTVAKQPQRHHRHPKTALATRRKRLSLTAAATAASTAASAASTSTAAPTTSTAVQPPMAVRVVDAAPQPPPPPSEFSLNSALLAAMLNANNNKLVYGGESNADLPALLPTTSHGPVPALQSIQSSSSSAMPPLETVGFSVVAGDIASTLVSSTAVVSVPPSASPPPLAPLTQRSSSSVVVTLPLTPGKQRLTAVERLAEIKERKLQEAMRKLLLADTTLAAAAAAVPEAATAAAATTSTTHGEAAAR